MRRWLRPAQPERCGIIEDPEKKSIQLRISGYLSHSRQERQPETKPINPGRPPPSTAIFEQDVFEAFHGKTALIFANAKSDIEKLADYARRESERRGLPDHFGSITARFPRASERKRKKP